MSIVLLFIIITLLNITLIEGYTIHSKLSFRGLLRCNERKTEDSSSSSAEADFEALKAQIASMIEPDVVTESNNALPSSSPSSSSSPFNKNIVASCSFLLGVLSFTFLHNQPASGVAILKAMEKDSLNIGTSICNGKPTIVDFYADWCESCKVMAPSMRALEIKYRDEINFITVDGANPANADLVARFRVDGIPHVAFVTPEAEVKTALVGAVPKKILDENMVALVQEKELPHEGYDAFDEESHFKPLSNILQSCRLQTAN